MAKCLTADEILGADDLPKEFVVIPEWQANGEACGVWIKTLTAKEKEHWENEATDSKGKAVVGFMMATAVAHAAVDETGKRLFTDAQANKLAEKNGPAINRLWNVFRKLNTITDKDVDDMAKNLPGGQTASSDSTSLVAAA